MFGLAMVVGLVLLDFGCIGVFAGKGTHIHGSCREQAVAMNGEIYVVDVCDNTVWKVDPNAVAGAETVYRTELTTTETETTGG